MSRQRRPPCLLGAPGAALRDLDRSLIRLIGQARRFNDMVMNGHGKSISELASEAGVSSSYFKRVFRLSFLASEISKTILHSRQPAMLSAKTLLLQRKLAPAWLRQRVQLGLV